MLIKKRDDQYDLPQWSFSNSKDFIMSLPILVVSLNRSYL